jgi:hypothetical protein
MRFSKVILTTITALAVSAAPAFASSSKAAADKKPAASAGESKNSKGEKKLQGTVLSLTDDTMVIRAGKGKDEVFKIDPSTRKSGDISAGNKVTVNYHNHGSQHVATDIAASSAVQ